MPRKKKTPVVTPAIDLPKEFLEKLIPGPMDAAGVEAVFQQLKKAVIERALGAELGLHLADAEGGSGNHRNGRSGKTVLTDEGPLRIDVPRDRTGTFEPQLIPKHERRFAGFDERIVSMYARGMTVREIQGHLAEMYSVEVSPEFISKVTDEVMAEVTAWQARPLEAMYPVVFFDALRVKIREDGVVRNKAVYLALGVLADGTRDILGLWIENTEGAKFWMKVFNDLKTRGVNDILIGVADGLKGFPEALEAVFPATTLQTCIVHLIRNSLDFAGWKERKALAQALRLTTADRDHLQQLATISQGTELCAHARQVAARTVRTTADGNQVPAHTVRLTEQFQHRRSVAGRVRFGVGAGVQLDAIGTAFGGARECGMPGVGEQADPAAELLQFSDQRRERGDVAVEIEAIFEVA